MTKNYGVKIPQIMPARGIITTNLLLPYSKSFSLILIILLVCIAFLIRVLPIYHCIFTNWPSSYGQYVNFAADDAVYHMRLAHNTLYHFPWRVFFDPFTHFPFGNQIHFGPLFTLIIVGSAWLLGLGHPTHELINVAGAFLPPIMGALCIIPTYCLSRTLFGKNAALLAAFILAFLPGEFLQRSALGYADHHVAEVLFSTLACCFFILALQCAKKLKQQFTLKDPITIIYCCLAGFAYGLYILTWPAALMFGVIFFLFFLAQLLLEHLQNRPTSYLFAIATFTYTIPTLMVLPYALMNPRLDITYYSFTQLLALLILLLLFVACFSLHRALQNYNLPKVVFPLALVAIVLLLALIISLLLPHFYVVAIAGIKLLFHPNAGMRAISEVWPSLLSRSTGHFTLSYIWVNYYWALPLSIIGLVLICYRAYKQQQPAIIFLLIWSTSTFLAAFAQSRFNYYLAINIAILSGYAFYCLLELITKLKFLIPCRRVLFCGACIIFIFLTVDPIENFLAVKVIPSGDHISREWYDTLIWLKQHTPDPQGKIIDSAFAYATGYYKIPSNPTARYPYPPSAYGIAASWDVGHQITYIAERIPNSNPFQQGVVENNGKAGIALFFTTQDEAAAVDNLAFMGSRYILIDLNIATAVFTNLTIWSGNPNNWLASTTINTPDSNHIPIKIAGDSKKFTQSMLSRLYYFDCNGLQYFRLIYESNGKYFVTDKETTIEQQPLFHTNNVQYSAYQDAMNYFSKANKIFWTNDKKTALIYQARPPVKAAKIFEKVKGATLVGKIANDAPNSPASLQLKLITNSGRMFTYTQKTLAHHGQYQFVVPYPTTLMRGDGYDYDVHAVGLYKITAAGKTTNLAVSESAVMQGTTIKVP